MHIVNIEQKLVESLDKVYIRLPVLDHKHPSDEVVDKFKN